MAPPSLFSVLVAVALFAHGSYQQKDPLKDFCRRFGHQTAVIDNRLFIDGGQVVYQQNSLNYTNTNLLYSDLSVDNEGMPQQYSNLSKPANVPSVSGGALWPDTVNKRLFLYGGEFQGPPQDFAVWTYDALYNKWDSLPPDVSSNRIQRASFGASAVVQDRGMGYWYGGIVSNATVPSWGGPPLYLSNLLQFNMVTNTWSNITGYDSVGRAEGVMVYVPASDGGMLVYFGGVQSPSNNGSWIGQPLDTIFLYDIGNAKWYTQKATGDIPEMRRRFCGGVTWAPDKSSYNIYIYGGASMPPLTVGFDDLYILSLPTFTWIKWYPTEPGAAFPHHSLSCDVINTAQMIVMGGTFPNSTACDIPEAFGQHNADLGKQNPDGESWAEFVYNKTTYKVPSEVIAVVGGSGGGGATKKLPKAGFDNPDVADGFGKFVNGAKIRTPTRVIPSATAAPPPAPPPKKKNTGAIIGGAVAGGVLALVILGALVYMCLRRKNQDSEPPVQEIVSPPMKGNPSYGYYPVYPAAVPPTQLPANEEAHIAELQGPDVAAGHKSWGSVSPAGEVPGYSYAPTSASLLSSPSQSSPVQSSAAHSPVPQPSQSQAVPSGAPAGVFPTYVPQPAYEQPQPQVYYPAPSPSGAQYSPPAAPYVHYEPPQQQAVSNSPEKVIPRKGVAE